MESTSPIMRDIPSLAAHLGDGARADEFEEWVEDIEHMNASKAHTDDEKAMARILRTLTIACVETGRIETDSHGRSFDQVISHLARAAGVAVMGAVLSVARDSLTKSEISDLAAIITDDFRVGANLIADGQSTMAPE